MTKITDKGRNQLLATVGTAMAATMMATGAQAAETIVTPISPPVATTNATGQDIIDEVLNNIASITAEITDSDNPLPSGAYIDVVVDNTTTTSYDVSTQTFTATAIGNNFSSDVDLSVIENDEDGDGAAALSYSVNTVTYGDPDNGQITAILESQDIFVDVLTNVLDDTPQDGSYTVKSNALKAAASANSGTTTLAGEIPNGYVSTTGGSSFLDTNGPVWLDADGSLVASTLQVAINPDVETEVNGNSIHIELISDGDNNVVAQPTVEGNSIAGVAKGNSSTSTIDIQAGDAPTFAGTAVVTNAQTTNYIDADTYGEVESDVGNNDIFGVVEGDDYVTDVNELNGSLIVDANTISSTASGNEALGAASGQAGNRILLADGMSFDGLGSAASVDTVYSSTEMTGSAVADLVIHNSQGNVSSANDERMEVDANTYNNEIYADAQSVDGATVSVSDNAVTSLARNNVASSALATGANSATFSGTVAVANQQTNLFSNTESDNDDTYIGSEVGYDGGVTVASTVTVDGNRSAATSYGNQVTQSVAIEATTVDLPRADVLLTGGTGPDGNLSADGSVLVTSLQSQYSSNVTAGVGLDGASYIEAESWADVTVDSTLAATDNTQEAVALGNLASNGLAITGTSVDTGAGIASVQIVADDSMVVAGSLANVYVGAYDVQGSDLELSGNLQRSIAYGGSATNALSIDAENITVDAAVENVASTVIYDAGNDGGFVLDGYDSGDIISPNNAPVVAAAYGVLNVQSVDAVIGAIASGDGEYGSFELEVDGSATDGSTLTNDANQLVGAAYGTNASNSAALDVGNLGSSDDGFVSVLNLTNVQTVTPDSVITAGAVGGPVVNTTVSESITDSSVSTSGNTVQALTYGNLAGNTVSVDANNIDTEADSTGFFTGIRGEASVEGGVAITDASFGLNNVQSADGIIGATTVIPGDIDTDPVAVTIVTTQGDPTGLFDVRNSSIVSDDNTISSGATGNRADNLLDLAGNDLATTGALTNFQTSGAIITSEIGVAGGERLVETDPGTPDTPADPFTFDVTGSGLAGNASGSTVTLTAGTLSVPTSSLTPAQITYLQTKGWVVNGSNLELSATVLGSISLSNYGSLVDGDPVAFNDTVPLVPGTPPSYATVEVPAQGGILVRLGDDVINSTISVSDNTVAGSVTGNSASNKVKVDGNNIADGSDHIATWAIIDGGDTTALADYQLTNVQLVEGNDTDGADLNSTVYSSFGIDMTNENLGTLTTILDSSLSVDGNEQSSRAVANTAANTIEFEANNSAAGVSLASNQLSDAAVNASSVMDIFAPVASNGTSVSMSDNTNLALGVINNATNTVTVDTNNADQVTFTRDANLDIDTGLTAAADHTLGNQQIASTAVSATAATRIFNDDSSVDETDGILSGTVKVEGNVTSAEASANRAVNQMTVSAASSLVASAGVANLQSSRATVNASATTQAGVSLAGDSAAPFTAAAVNSSTVQLGDNTTTALARGNAATNALNYTAGADYGSTTPFGDASASIGLGASVDARAAVLNAQNNTGAVTATSTNASYLVALNTDSTTPTITNATVGVIGNSLSAAAYGNTATNVLTVGALNTNQPTAAIGNAQFNSGPVTATVTTVTYGITSGLGAVTGSSLSVTGNSVTATAIGNNAVNVLTAGN